MIKSLKSVFCSCFSCIFMRKGNGGTFQSVLIVFVDDSHDAHYLVVGLRVCQLGQGQGYVSHGAAKIDLYARVESEG